jgi:hypothetical protein
MNTDSFEKLKSTYKTENQKAERLAEGAKISNS